MENAIKALLISAGVLITILVISLGIYIYSKSNGADQAGSTVSSLEVQAFNEKFKRYEGNQRGGIVKKLLQEAILNNQEGDRWQDDSITSRCVCVRTNVKDILDNFSGDDAMISGLDGSREFGVKYPSNIQRIANCVERNQRYKVYFTYNNAGFIWEIHIEDI